MSNLRYSEEVESIEEGFVLDLEDSNEAMSAGDGLSLTGDIQRFSKITAPLILDAQD